jgi:hypothetical protein
MSSDRLNYMILPRDYTQNYKEGLSMNCVGTVLIVERNAVGKF